jgi:hypothetical protein
MSTIAERIGSLRERFSKSRASRGAGKAERVRKRRSAEAQRLAHHRDSRISHGGKGGHGTGGGDGPPVSGGMGGM